MADPKAALAALNKKYNVKSSQKDDEEEKKASSGKTTSTNKTTQRESNPAAESNASRPKTALANLNKKYNVTGKKTSDTSSTSRNATLRPSQSSASQVLGRTVGGNGTSSVWRGPAPEDTTRFSGGSYGGGGGRNGRTTSNTTVTEDVFGDNTRKFGNSNIEFKYDPVEKEAEAPVYRRETAENLRKALEDAETALTQKRESGMDIESDMQRREKDIGKLESQLKSLSDAYKKNQSEELYNRYQQLYSQYEWDIKQYNTLLNEYKGLADNYNNALDEYNTYMDTAKSDASFLETVGDVAWKGISGINRAFTSSLDFLLPSEFLGEYDYVSKLSDYYKSIDEHYQENLDESMYGRGPVANIAAELGVGTIEALPNALLSLASGGTSALAQGGTLLSGAANSGLASTIGSAVRQMAKNPMYWTSFLQTVGTDYESAKEDGASDLQAAATALISSALNAGVEIGGGLETLPGQLKSGNTSAVKQWVKSMFEEGREEVVQGVISGIMQKAMYDQDKDIYSSTDENAIINPGRMAQEFGMGAGVGGILGGAQIGTVSALNAGIDRANNRRMSELGTIYQADRQAVIDEGLSFSPDTEAYQTASQLQAKVDAGGTLTDADVGRAVAANERTIQQEERIAQANIQPAETIEDAAREVVANQEKIAQSEEKGGTERISNPFSGYNAMSDSNPIRQQRLNAEKMVKKMTGYGDYGTRAIMDVMEQEHVTMDQAKAQFQTAYEAGMTDMPVAKVNLTSDLQRIAFNAGKQDYIMSSTKAAEATKYVKVWSKGGGLIQNDYASRLETRTAYMLHAIGKATGTKIIVEEIPAEQNANGYYQDSNGTIHIDINTTQPVMTVVKHELTHRMQALAPKEYRQFRNYAVQVMSETGWNTYGSNTAIESQQQDYFERSGGRVNLNTEEAMDEIAANFTEKILTDEKALNDFVNLVTQSPEHRTMGQKFFQAVRDFIDKIKSVFKGNKSKMDAAAQEEFGATVDQLEKAEQLWKDAFKAATQNAQTAETQKNTDQTDGVKYSLNADFNKQFDQWMSKTDAERANSHFRFFVGTTSDALQSIGVSDYKIYWNAGKIAKIMKKHQSMTADVIKSVPNVLENPILVMQSQTVANRITLFGETMDADGRPVLAAVELAPQKKSGEVQDFAVIASAYGKNNAQSIIDSSDVLYVDPNKKRTDNWLLVLRLQLPSSITSYGPISKVTLVKRDVKGNISFGESGKTAMQAAFEKAMEQGTFSDNVSYSLKVTDKDTLDFLDNQDTVTTYKTMQIVDGKLYPPMAARINGQHEDYSVLGSWEQAVEHPELIKNGNKFKLDKGKGQGSLEAAYNPYMHSSNLVLNDQFTGAYTRDNLVTVECEVPVSELTSGYHAEFAKDSVGWHSWHTGTVAGAVRKAKGIERQVLLSRWIKPVRIVPNAEVAKMYKDLLGTDIAVPDNVVTPDLLAELKKAGVKIKESGRVKEPAGAKFSLKDSAGRTLTEQQQKFFKDSKVRDKDGNLLVVYHGTGSDFTVFDKSRVGENYPGGISDLGFYFTPYREDAVGYASNATSDRSGRRVMASYLNLKNPLIVEDEGWGSAASQADIRHSDLMRWAKDGGHDGIIVRSTDEIMDDDGTADAIYIAFNSNQIKNIDNENPTSNPDIRFSLKKHNDLIRENAKLKETVDGLRDQFKVTTFAQVDKKSLDRFTKQLLKDYHSGAEINDTRDALNALYGYMANGENGEGPVWNEVYKRAYETAQNILENASVLDDEMYQEYKALRDELRTRGMTLDRQFTSDLVGYESISDFRKAYMGRIKLVKYGTPVDVVYNDLAARYPEFFNEERTNNPADQLLEIAEVLDGMQPTEHNPYSYNMREAATWLANDIIERFYELPQAKPTFADKAEQKLTKQVIKGAKKMERMRYQKNERIKALIEENRKKVKAVQAKERAKRAEAVQDVKEHYKAKEAKSSDSRKAQVLRAKITRHAQDMSAKLLRPTDKQHIPQQLQGAVAELLASINLESNYTFDPETQSYKKSDDGLPTRRTKAFTELKQVYQELANSLVIDPDLMGDDGLLSGVIAMADKRIVDMSRAELETVWQTIRAVEATVMTANKAFSKAKWESISEAAEGLREDNKGKSLKTEYLGGLGKMQKLTGLDMMTPETYMHMLGKSGDGMFRVIRDAQDTHIRMMAEVSDFTHEKLKNVNVNKLENEMHTVTLGGEDVKLSTAQIMELYALMRRQQAQDHIMTGGILPDVVSAKGIKKITRAEPLRGITMQEIGNALSVLTDEQKQMAEVLQSFASTTLSKWGNEASMKVYNYEKFNEPVYWPIRTNKQEISSDVSKDTAVTTVAGRGFTKQTKPNANTSVRLGSIFDTFATHSSEMATYAAWLGATEDINRIRNYQFTDEYGNRTGTVKGIIERVHGTQGTAYLNKLLSDISNGVKGTHAETQFMSGLVGNYKAAAVGANLRVIIQQPTAILRSLDMIGPQYLVAGMKPSGGWKKAVKYAPIAQWKDWGYFDINTGRQMKDVLFDSDRVLDKVKNVSMWGAGKADSISWGLLWNACEAETKAKRKDLKAGTDAYYQAVADRFTEIVDHTQVVDGIVQRSQIMRSADGLTKMATSFMGEPTKQYNMFLSAAYDAKHGKSADTKKRLARSAVALAVSGVVNAMAQSVMDAARDDDKEKKYWEKWLNALIGFEGDEETAKDYWDAFWAGNLGNTFNPATYVPYVKDIVSIIQGYDVSRMDMESVEKTISAAQNMIKALNGEGKYTIGSASATLFAEAARMIGVPVSNLKRDVKSIAMTYAIETDNYLMQYRMEKASLELNYSGNGGTFVDILFNAYKNDKDAYELIYADMVKSGFDPEKIQNGMETRMKKDQGVTKVSELESRYLNPADHTEWDSKMKPIQSSSVWKSANAEQRDNLEDRLYGLVTGTASDETMEYITEGSAYGIDETDYLLWKTALEMVDQPADTKGHGNYSNQEKAEAISNMDLSDSEIAYLWDTNEGYEAYAAGIDMGKYAEFKSGVDDIKADKNASGKTIRGSRETKFKQYLNSLGLDYDDWLWLYSTEYEKVEKWNDYKKYFG